MPYSPMREPEKPVTHDRMQEILSKNSSKATRSGAARSPTHESRRIPLLDHELWLAKRLGQHGVEIFTGDTTPELRRERFREAIKTAGVEMVIVGRTKDGAPETYQECLDRLYGVDERREDR
jgi:hypothetical protein